jgi:DNA replication protein DnaC
LLQLCRLPVGAEHMTFNTFRHNNQADLVTAYNTCIDLAQETNNVRWVTLMARVGRGKTHLAYAVCHEWLRRGKPARFAFVPLLLKELRDGLDREGEQSYGQLFDFYCRFPLLVLDDLGVENPTPWAQEQLQSLIDYRLINALPMLVTTNYQLDELKGDKEHRIGSRLRRESWCRVVAIDAEEHRSSSIPEAIA